jgi:hypothetical protein
MRYHIIKSNNNDKEEENPNKLKGWFVMHYCLRNY